MPGLFKISKNLHEFQLVKKLALFLKIELGRSSDKYECTFPIFRSQNSLSCLKESKIFSYGTQMKRIKPLINFQKKYCFSLGIKILLIFLINHGTAQGKSEIRELVSLNIRNAPLAEVLDKVSQTSGYEFIIDENWYDLPISVTFDAIPLEQALKRILANVNHAIVYNSDRRVLIRIYENDSSISRNTGTSTINRYPYRPTYQSPLNETPTSPNPVPPEPSAEETKTEESDMSSHQPETPEEEDENEDEDTSEEEDEENLEEEGVDRQ